MAVRTKQKRSKAGSTRSRRTAGGSKASARAPTVDQLLRERDGLQDQLDAALLRISELEKLNEEVANRIDWVVDSLRNALPDSRS